MKRIMTILALASLPALAACGQQSADGNASAENINRLGAAEPEAAAMHANEMSPEGNGADVVATPEPNTPAPASREGAEQPRKAEPAPARRERLAPPPVDPHAGHDMGNMANMQH